jgi:hypothetical protein
MEQIEKTVYTRGGIEWEESRGINEQGDMVLYHQRSEAEDGLVERLEPNTMRVEWIQGKLKVISVRWQRVFITVSGKRVGEPEPLDMSAHTADIQGFTQVYGEGIGKSLSNGVICAVQGYDQQPLYDGQTGEHLPDTLYDTAAAPTHGYHTA